MNSVADTAGEPTTAGRLESVREVAGPVALAALLVIGALKGPIRDWPLDATLMVAVVCALLAVISLVREGIPRGVWWMVGLCAVMLPPALWATSSAYGEEKVPKLALTFLAAIAPLFLIRTARQQATFLWSVAVAGVVMSFAAVVETRPDLYGRRAGFGANTVEQGRMSGLSVTVLAVGLVRRAAPRLLLAVGLVLAFYALLASGARGPLGAAVLSAGVAAVAGWRGPVRISRTAVAVTAVVVVVVAVLLVLTPSYSLDRLRDPFGHTGVMREGAWAEAWDLAITHPLGAGWASFEDVSTTLNPGDRHYPHNIVLEMAAEAGWIAAAVLVAVLAVALVRAWRAARTGGFTDAGILAVLVFATLNAMVSGDVNDNRLLFAMIALGLSQAYVGSTA